MCNSNHACFTKPGYLIDVKAESIAANGALFTRMLAHHAEVGLTDEQIRGLLTLSGEYHERLVAGRIRMAKLGEQVEHKGCRLGVEEIAARKAALDERAELFRADEALFFEYTVRGQDLLSDEQLDRIDAIYHAEKDQGLAELESALANAVGPNFVFTSVA
ncbi:hypothetical protein [Frankia sp. CcWB2]